MGADRFVVNLQEGKDADATSSRLMQEVLKLTGQVNQAQIPIVMQQGDPVPEGMLPGQPVIQWSTNAPSTILVWNGSTLS